MERRGVEERSPEHAKRRISTLLEYGHELPSAWHPIRQAIAQLYFGYVMSERESEYSVSETMRTQLSVDAIEGVDLMAPFPMVRENALGDMRCAEFTFGVVFGEHFALQRRLKIDATPDEDPEGVGPRFWRDPIGYAEGLGYSLVPAKEVQTGDLVMYGAFALKENGGVGNEKLEELVDVGVSRKEVDAARKARLDPIPWCEHIGVCVGESGGKSKVFSKLARGPLITSDIDIAAGEIRRDRDYGHWGDYYWVLRPPEKALRSFYGFFREVDRKP